MKNSMTPQDLLEKRGHQFHTVYSKGATQRIIIHYIHMTLLVPGPNVAALAEISGPYLAPKQRLDKTKLPKTNPSWRI